MKKIFTLLLFIAATICLHAQNEVILRLDHQLDGKAFALNQETVSPSGSKYKLTRLQFYLSGIRIWHDGNQEMSLPQLYFLVDPSKTTARELSLGILNNVANIEKIEFAIGVDAASNHLDPASYPASHALAPKNPTMHWGWTSGYRFITLEGKVARSNGLFLDDLAIHTVGDQNFKLKSYVTGGKLDQGKLYVDMKAEYNLLLDGIVIAGGQNNHGETGSAATLCLNGSTKVFQPASPTANKEVFEHASTDVIYDQNIPVIRYRFDRYHNLEFQLFNLQGQRLRNDVLAHHEGNLLLDNPLATGHYYYLFSDGQRILSTGKVLIR